MLFQLTTANAQTSEIGIIGGVSYYIGDLNNTHFKNSQFSAGILYRYNINDRISLRINYLYGSVRGDDSQSKDVNRVNRNLSFKSTISELGAMIEINYYSYKPGNRKDELFTTYIVAGFNYFKMNPKAQYLDVTYELQPLNTEGQSLPGGPDRYSLDAFAIPLGLGAKVNLSKRISISIEYSFRFTFTDYLDDVSTVYYFKDVLASEIGDISAELSDRRLNKENPAGIDGQGAGLQRGDSARNDWYGFAGIFLSFRIGKDPNSCAKWN